MKTPLSFRYLSTISILGILFPYLGAIAQSSSRLFITEVAAFEPGDTEWVEIYNPGPDPIDLTGWKFIEDGTNHGLTAWRGEPVLGGGTAAVIANKAELFAQKYPEYTGAIFDSTWSSLKLDGEEIGLKDATGSAVELFTYPVASDGASIERVSNAVAANESTNWRTAVATHSLGTVPPSGTDSAISPSPVITEPADTGSAPPELSAPSPAPENENQPVTQPAELPPPPTETVQTPAPIPAPPVPVNQPPHAAISIQSGSLIGQGSVTINFDGRGSFDPDGDALTFVWDLGDGVSVTSANPGVHSYRNPGTYAVQLTVRDVLGAAGTASTTVQVLGTTTAGGGSAIIGVSAISPPAPSSLIAVASTAPYSSISQATAVPVTPPLLSEIFPAPASKSGDTEWIEIYNPNPTRLNLGNWLLADESKLKKPYRIPDSTLVPAHGYIVFTPKQTKISLNNGSDSVFLATPEGEPVDSVTYRDARPAMSYVRSSVTDRSAQWLWIRRSTQGSVNPPLQDIRGTVTQAPESSEDGSYSKLAIKTAEGQTTTIHFDDSILNDEVGKTLFSEGSAISITAEPDGENSYSMQALTDVAHAQGDEPFSEVRETSESSVLNRWLYLGLMVCIGMSGMNGYVLLKQHLAKKRGVEE